MTKAEIIHEVSRKTGIGRSDVRLTLETLLEVIQQTMENGESVHFRGFGSFKNKKKGKKLGRNITSNTALIIEERHVPSFSPAKIFSKRIRESLRP